MSQFNVNEDLRGEYEAIQSVYHEKLPDMPNQDKVNHETKEWVKQMDSGIKYSN